jgi:hypothetical protein
MFKVILKFPKGPREFIAEFTVFDVIKENGFTKFLIYKDKEFQWIDSSRFVPFEK